MGIKFIDETPLRLKKGMTDLEMIESARGPGSQYDQKKRAEKLREKIANWIPGKPKFYWIKAKQVTQFGKALQLTLKEDKTTWVNEDTERKEKSFLIPDWKIANEDLYQWVDEYDYTNEER